MGVFKCGLDMLNPKAWDLRRKLQKTTVHSYVIYLIEIYNIY